MLTKLPLDSSVEAEYEDGYVHSETELDDCSPYEEQRNVFYDILNGLPEAEHGRMVRFSAFWQNNRYDVDWRDVPESARPIRFRHGYSTFNPATGDTESGWTGIDFGYQWNDETGHNHQEVIKL